MTPYYDHAGIVIYHGDCRDILPHVTADVVVTDPPYPNRAGFFDDSVETARAVLAALPVGRALVFWNELEFPPVSLPIVAVHVWHRANVNGRPYEPVFEFCVDGVKRRSEVFSSAAVFDGVGPGCNQFAGHPTQKELHVMRWLVKKTDGTILDPFMGSGTTLVAAKQLGRKAIGIEIEERYCEIAVKRLAQEVLPLESSKPEPTQQEFIHD